MNSLPKTVTRQRRDCDLNPGPSAPESSTLTTRLPSHPKSNINRPGLNSDFFIHIRTTKIGLNFHRRVQSINFCICGIVTPEIRSHDFCRYIHLCVCKYVYVALCIHELDSRTLLEFSRNLSKSVQLLATSPEVISDFQNFTRRHNRATVTFFTVGIVKDAAATCTRSSAIAEGPRDAPCQLNRASILYRFRDIASYLSTVADFNPPHLHLAPLQGLTQVEFR